MLLLVIENERNKNAFNTVFSHGHRKCAMQRKSTNNKLYHRDIQVQVLITFND